MPASASGTLGPVPVRLSSQESRSLKLSAELFRASQIVKSSNPCHLGEKGNPQSSTSQRILDAALIGGNGVQG